MGQMTLLPTARTCYAWHRSLLAHGCLTPIQENDQGKEGLYAITVTIYSHWSQSQSAGSRAQSGQQPHYVRDPSRIAGFASPLMGDSSSLGHPWHQRRG